MIHQGNRKMTGCLKIGGPNFCAVFHFRLQQCRIFTQGPNAAEGVAADEVIGLEFDH